MLNTTHTELYSNIPLEQTGMCTESSKHIPKKCFPMINKKNSQNIIFVMEHVGARKIHVFEKIHPISLTTTPCLCGSQIVSGRFHVGGKHSQTYSPMWEKSVEDKKNR